MNNDCKVCTSEKREYIEKLILQGNSNLLISTTIKDLGEDISHASINRHKTKHMPEHAETIKENSHEKCNRKYDRDDSQNSFTINANAIYEEIKNLALHSIDYDELAHNNYMMQLMLNRIVNNQLAITIDLQDKYMKGNSKYPHEQIRGLQIVQEMMLKFEVYTRQNFEHYKRISTDKSGISDHIYESGRKAKIGLNKTTPYVKGDVFKFMLKEDYDIEEYYEKYMPKNPYCYERLNGENMYFDNGIKAERSEDEKLDLKLYDLLCDSSISEKLHDKLLKQYSENDYDGNKEIARLQRIVNEKKGKDE